MVSHESVSSLVESFHFNCFDGGMSGGEIEDKEGKEGIRLCVHMRLFDRRRMILNINHIVK